jgi:hypothetical protein
MNGRATIGRPAGTVAENLFLENHSFRPKRPPMTRMTRIGADLLRVNPHHPLDRRSLAAPIGKLNSPEKL